MLSYAPAHAPVMGMTSDQPSGIHPIRVLYGSILGHFLRPRGARVASSRRLLAVGTEPMYHARVPGGRGPHGKASKATELDPASQLTSADGKGLNK